MLYFCNLTGYSLTNMNNLGSIIRHMIAIGVFFFCAVMFCGCGEKNSYVIDTGDELKEEAKEESKEEAKEESKEEAIEDSIGSTDMKTDRESGFNNEEVTTKQMDVYVQVCGAVHSPGVYLVPWDSRVFHAIELAGGVCENADVAAVNMARYVEDEMVIYVPLIGEDHTVSDVSTAQSTSISHDNKVNINTASREILMTLKGIGQVKADAIITYRTECGSFVVIEDILKVDGIKQSTFDAIKEQISVGE